MQAYLPTISFVTILLLILILPGQLKSTTIPAVSIIAWLFVCNIIHAVNSLVWADNAGLHVPVWCDISTKILLGAMVAVPGALFCISRQLEVLTSHFEYTKMPSQRHKATVDSVMCIVFPVLYMSLHTIVQFRRFSILEDLGCQAAVHDSLPGLVLVWLPPFLISAVALFYNFSAAFNIFKSHYNSSTYFPSLPELSLSLFLRRLTFTTVAVLYTSIAYALVLSWSSTNLQPWTSIPQVHANFSEPQIIQRGTRLAVRSALIWWSIPVWSLLLCALSGLGEETKKGYRVLWALVPVPGHRRSRTMDLPLHDATKSNTKRPRVAIPARPPSPVHLRGALSPWEATVRADTTLKLKSRLDLHSAALSPTMDDASFCCKGTQDASFTQSTLSYLDSDAARQLQLPSPPPVTVSHYRTQTFGEGLPTSLRASPTDPRTQPSRTSPTPASAGEKYADVKTPRPLTAESAPRSRTSSILSTSAWPQPPPSPPSLHPYALVAQPAAPMTKKAPQVQPDQPRALSPAPSFSSDSQPFQGPSILEMRTIESGLRRAPSARAKGKARAGAIQMTVVRETLVGDA